MIASASGGQGKADYSTAVRNGASGGGWSSARGLRVGICPSTYAHPPHTINGSGARETRVPPAEAAPHRWALLPLQPNHPRRARRRDVHVHPCRIAHRPVLLGAQVDPDDSLLGRRPAPLVKEITERCAVPP